MFGTLTSGAGVWSTVVGARDSSVASRYLGFQGAVVEALKTIRKMQT